MLASTFHAVYLLHAVIAFIRMQHAAESFQVSPFGVEQQRVSRPVGMRESAPYCNRVTGIEWFCCFYGWREYQSDVACLNTAVEVFHKPNLSDWQCFSGQNNGCNEPHTHAVHLSPHRRAGPRKRQQCRWAEAHTCTNTWPCTHSHTHSFLCFTRTHKRTGFDSFASVRVHNPLCCSAPNETPQRVWLDLIRVDSIEAGVEGGEHILRVCVFQVLQDSLHPAVFQPPSFSLCIGVNLCLALPERQRAVWSKSGSSRKHHATNCSEVSCSAEALQSLSVPSSWCISHICTVPHTCVHTQKSWLLYHFSQFPAIPSRRPLASSDFSKRRTYMVHSSAWGNIQNLVFKGFV